MKISIRNTIIKIINIQTVLIILMLILPSIVHAQAIPGGDPDSAPVDGGLSLLIAGGVGYGVKKMRARKKQSEIEK